MYIKPNDTIISRLFVFPKFLEMWKLDVSQWQELQPLLNEIYPQLQAITESIILVHLKEMWKMLNDDIVVHSSAKN